MRDADIPVGSGAAAHFMRWLTEQEGGARPAVICYDSEYAANQAQGFHQAHKNNSATPSSV